MLPCERPPAPVTPSSVPAPTPGPAPTPTEGSSMESFREVMFSALPNLLRSSEAISRGLETTAPAAECVACEMVDRPPLTLSTTPSLKPVTLAPTSFRPCCMSRSTSLGCRGMPCCSTSRSLRYSATLSSRAVCSILICSVSLRIFCCSCPMACLVRCGSGVLSSAPAPAAAAVAANPSAPHDRPCKPSPAPDWAKPLTSSRSIWKTGGGEITIERLDVSGLAQSGAGLGLQGLSCGADGLAATAAAAGAGADDSTPDPQRTKQAIGQLQQKILKLTEQIKIEQTARDDNVAEYLKLANNADKQQSSRIKQHVLGLPRDAVLLHLAQLAVVVLQLALQLLDVCADFWFFFSNTWTEREEAGETGRGRNSSYSSNENTIDRKPDCHSAGGRRAVEVDCVWVNVTSLVQLVELPVIAGRLDFKPQLISSPGAEILRPWPDDVIRVGSVKERDRNLAGWPAAVCRGAVTEAKKEEVEEEKEATYSHCQHVTVTAPRHTTAGHPARFRSRSLTDPTRMTSSGQGRRSVARSLRRGELISWGLKSSRPAMTGLPSGGGV
ncbi:hypothetical protein CRUP_017997 [Coryphaenoides rupestris]|nr:hypothetical protein CRUP_017997 [Coryphaenoides rupestris]